MASRFWVGGTGTWDASDTTHWAATSGGAGGVSVPGSGDTVTFDGSSGGGTVTVGYDPSVISITGGAFTGTLDFATSNPTMQTFSFSGTGTRTLNYGSGNWTITGNNATVWTTQTTTNMTTVVGTATINLTYAGGTGTRAVIAGAELPNFSVSAGSDVLALGSTLTCANFNLAGFTGNWNTTTTLTCKGNFTLGTGMTVTTQTGVISMTATSGTKTITSNGVTLNRPLTINGVGGTFQLVDAYNGGTTTTSILTLTNGTFDTNNQTVIAPGLVSSNSNTRVLTLGSSSITLSNSTAGTVFAFTTSTGLTITANTATITLTGSSPDFGEGTNNWHGASIVMNSSGSPIMRGTSTWANITRINPAGTDAGLNLAGNKTITGTFTLKGSSDAIRVRLTSNQSQTLPSTRVITAAAIDFEYVNLTDIQGAGAANWDLSAITGGSGDGGGNVGITFTPAVTQYWYSNTGSWSDASKWFLGTGGTGGAGRIPLIQDTAIFDANSFSSTGNTITMDLANFGALDCSQSLPGQTFNYPQNTRAYGSISLASNTTLPSNFSLSIVGRMANTLKSSGSVFGGSITQSTVGYSLTLQDDVSTSATFTIFVGSFDSANKNITANTFNSSGTSVRSVTLGTSTVTITGTGTVWNVGTTTNLTFSGASSTIIFTDASASSKTFSTGTGAAAYGNFIALPGGAGAIVFNSNSKSFNSLSITGPKTVTFNAGTTYTVLSPNFSGSSGSVVTLQSSSAGSPFILSTPSGYVRATYASIKDSTATGGAYFEAVNSTNVSGNTGWNFVTASAGGGLQAGKKFAAFGGARPINKVLDSKLHGYRKLGG